MANVTVTLRVVKPWWLPIAVCLAKLWFGWRAFRLGRELSDAELADFVEWYGRQFRTVVD